MIKVFPLAVAETKICAGYGPRPTPSNPNGFHDAVDICCPIGTPVVAVDDGTVSYSNNPIGGNVAVLHVGPEAYYFAHLSDWIGPSGRAVKAGETIALSGMTGNASLVGIPHLHFQVWPAGSYQVGHAPYPDPTAALLAAPHVTATAPVATKSSATTIVATIAGGLALVGFAGLVAYLISAPEEQHAPSPPRGKRARRERRAIRQRVWRALA